MSRQDPFFGKGTDEKVLTPKFGNGASASIGNVGKY